MPLFQKEKASESNDFMETLFSKAALPSRQRRSWSSLWQRGLLGILLATAGFCFSGSIFLEKDLEGDWQGQADLFHWLVLAQGNQVQIDEIGRFLKQWDGVKEVVYSSSEQLIDKLKKDPLIADDASFLEPAHIPASWQVRWSAPSLLLTNQMALALEETKRFPGVLDVAFDQAVLDHMQALRLRWLQLRLIISIFFLGGALCLLIFLGRVFFFSLWKKFSAPSFALTLLHDGMWWMLGFVVARQLLEGKPWFPLWIGLFVGAVRYVGQLDSEKRLKKSG